MKKLKIYGVYLTYTDLAIFRRNLTIALVFVFCLTQLSGCGVIYKQLAIDGPPRNDIDVSKIHDAVPKVEPLHPYGTRDYVLGGRHYRVLKSAKGYVKQGYASWYGSKFHGNETSTQERFNLYSMTAASPHLPLPTYVQVTNLRNGKKVIVKVNDRGPFHSNRILDLSYAAAKKLDFVGRGVVLVKVVAIDPKTWNSKKSSTNGPHDADAKGSAKERFLTESAPFISDPETLLQIGAFAKLDNAKQILSRVSKLISKPVYIEHKNDLYCVQVGPLASTTQGKKLKQYLEQNGFKTVTIVKE